MQPADSSGVAQGPRHSVWVAPCSWPALDLSDQKRDAFSLRRFASNSRVGWRAGAIRRWAPLILAVWCLVFVTDASAQSVIIPNGPSTGTLRTLCVTGSATGGILSFDSSSGEQCEGSQTAFTGLTINGATPATQNVQILGTGITMGTGSNLNVGGTTTLTGDTTVGATLGVTGATTTNGITNTGNVSTTTLSTTGAATLNSVGVTNNATVGGTLGVTGLVTTNGIDDGNAGITNAGAISGVSGLSGDGTGSITGFVDVTASGTVQGATLTDGAGTTISGGTVATNAVAAGTGNITTLNSTTINNAGAFSTNSVAVGVGGVTVSAGAPISMGGNRVQNVATPTNPTDAANKAYVDAMAGGGNNHFKEIDQNTEGIAVAMAMGGLSLPQGKTFAIGANLGFFQDKQAAAAQLALRLDENLTFNGGIGLGLETNEVGGRVGVMGAW